MALQNIYICDDEGVADDVVAYLKQTSGTSALSKSLLEDYEKHGGLTREQFVTVIKAMEKPYS